VEILANALPGFRNLRAPVIAGYLWLLFIWLLVDPDLDHPPTSGVAGTVWKLGEHVGHVALAIAVSVAAYLVGAVSVRASGALRALWDGFLRALWYLLPRLVAPRVGLPPLIPLHAVSGLRQVVNRARRRTSSIEVAPSALAALEEEYERAVAERRRELDLPATLLVGDKPALFAEVDRLRAEGELRLAAVVPLTALLIWLNSEESHWWLAGLLGALVLLDQGVRQIHESRQTIEDALEQEVVGSPASRRLTDWVRAWEQDPNQFTASGTVKDVMMLAQDFPAFDLGPNARPEDVRLDELLRVMRSAHPPYQRIPIRRADGAVLYVVHYSTLIDFRKTRGGQYSEDMGTFGDLLDRSPFKDIVTAIGFVAEDAAVPDARQVMASIPNCNDVFVTSTGKADEPAVGWLTDQLLARSPDVAPET
jgi:hypothetical protein